MRRSKNQMIYSALPGQFITFSSNNSDKENCKISNQCVININKWNTKTISKERIYFPKILKQIKADLMNFWKTEETPNVDMDVDLIDFYANNKKNYRFLELNNEKVNEYVRNDDYFTNQVFGNINPKLFYCPKCGKIKIMSNNNIDITNMYCDDCKEKLKQYNRIWICSCGKFKPIMISREKISEYRYFPKNKDGFYRNGKPIRLKPAQCEECNKDMKMINATDNSSFYPRIIKSINLIKNSDAELCKTKEGINLIIERQIGGISEKEFKSRKENLNMRDNDNSIQEFANLTGIEQMLRNINLGAERTYNIEPEYQINNINEIVAYKLLEYETLKNNVILTLKEATENLEKYEKIKNEEELSEILNIMGIKNISSVGNIEVINTAYGYTRGYTSTENLPAENILKIRAFKNSSIQAVVEAGNIDFLNNIEETEGILIELDKVKIIKYLQNNYEEIADTIININDKKEINKWFIENIDLTLINKYNEIENSITKKVYTLLHTISHMLINTFGENCGLEKNSLAEMIFPNVPAIFIYSQTIQGHVLGSLTDMFQRNLMNVLKDTYEKNKLCVFDPICMELSDGRCVGCSYLNEVVCEHFNKDLTRKCLYGYENDKEKIIGFWEE